MSSVFLCLPDKDILKTVLIAGGVSRLGVRREVVSGDEESSDPGRVRIIASLSHRIDVVVLANNSLSSSKRATSIGPTPPCSKPVRSQAPKTAHSSYPSLLGDTAIRLGSFRRHFRVT